MTDRTYTIVEIASALKISRSAVAKRAEKGAWSYTEKPVRGGKQRHYRPEDLPKIILRKLLAKRAIAAVKKSKPEITEFIVVLDGEVFEVRKIK